MNIPFGADSIHNVFVEGTARIHFFYIGRDTSNNIAKKVSGEV